MQQQESCRASLCYLLDLPWCEGTSVCVLVYEVFRSVHLSYRELPAKPKGNIFSWAGTSVFVWDINCQDRLWAVFASGFTEPLDPTAAWYTRVAGMLARRVRSAAFLDFSGGDKCQCQMAAYNVLTQRPQGCLLGIPESIIWTGSLQQSLKMRISPMWNVCCRRWSAAIWFAGSREVLVNIF